MFTDRFYEIYSEVALVIMGFIMISPIVVIFLWDRKEQKEKEKRQRSMDANTAGDN